ncbi:Fanconi anemia group M protein [Hyperolius riggenbachi]|uniref:Fanconi anemia group M protein n=1 Tax=Hyperolius riggenbachi TaxID=752182 RepID=UPI0035A30EE0
MNGKQRTLFQSWGSSVAPEPRRPAEPPAKKPRAKAARKGKNGTPCGGPPRATQPPAWHSAPPQRQEEEEDDDDVLLVAVFEAEKSLNASTSNNAQETQNQGTCPDAPFAPSAADVQNLPGFDLSAGNVWIYPTNLPVREYQFSMVQTALLHNTLVCLPTGLGKTFIAAVVMYNFYRWYPSGKIVFMAPTKPLVAQQIEACFRVMGIPQNHMVEMTGSTQAHSRRDVWQTHRVFFLTPQIMANDLTRNACPAADIKCLVIDEAHKALGNHAYCQVVRELCNYTRQFRILALSATPGSDIKSVQQVVSNLLVGRIELRSEDSPDILSYSHERQLEKFVVPLGDELEAVQKSYLLVLETVAGRLIQNNVLARRDIPNLTKYQIILSRDQFRKNPPSNIMGAQMGAVEGDYALCISLYHGYELLFQMGTRSLYYYLRSIMDGSKGMTRARNELSRNPDFMNLYQQLESMFSVPSGSDVKKPFIYSHPKLKKLEEVVIQHFTSWNKSGKSTSDRTSEDTRIMIFSSFRDSVQEIAEMLSQHHPTVKVMTFVGHSSTGKGVKGFTQKEQLEVVKRFREGGYNTLVSTCVGEEGLDIGEVDLIICFDAQKSPIRLVQRMGRTGRKRQGRIVVILCQGREERTYNQSQSNKRSIYKAIMGNNSVFHLNQASPRMVPEGLNPTVHKMYITQGSYDAKDSAKSTSKDRRSSLVHRKSSVFFNKEDTVREHGLLTPAESETWNRLYRLTDSDGVTDIILPRTQFELFKDRDAIMEPASGSIRELSLSEWKLWQNQPFPTNTVDHSARCKNFIAVMELIEQMRAEEDGCTYDEEMRSCLHKADVQPPCKTIRDSRSSVPSSKHSEKSTPFTKAKSSRKSGAVPIIEHDEDFIPEFKASKRKKSCSTERESADSIISVKEQVVEVINREGCDLGNDSADNMEIQECGKTIPSSPVHLEKRLSRNQTDVLKSPANVDSGYQSFSEECVDGLHKLFYTASTKKDHHPAVEFSEKSMNVLNCMLSRVKTFLSFSPPSLCELDSFEDVETTWQCRTPISLPCKKNNPNTSKLPPHDDQTSQNGIKQTNSMEVYPFVVKNDEAQFSEKVLSAQASPQEDDHAENVEEDNFEGAQIDPHWDDIFNCDDDDDDEACINNFDPPSVNSCSEHQDNVGSDETDIEKNDPPKLHSLVQIHKVQTGVVDSEKADELCNLSSALRKEKVKSEETALDVPLTLSPHQSAGNVVAQGELGETDFPECFEDSFDLFEDEAFADTEQLNVSKTCKLAKPDQSIVNFNVFDPSLLSDDSTGEENNGCLTIHEDLQQTEEEVENGSCELFSVNFDLGFSIEEDDHSEEDNTEDRQAENPCLQENRVFRAPSPAKRSNIEGGVMSTPVIPGTVNSTFGNMSETQISMFSPLQPVRGTFSRTPEKTMGSSFFTPRAEVLKTPNSLYRSIPKYDACSPATPKQGSKSINPLTKDIKSGLQPPKEKNRHSIIIGSSPESEDDVVIRRKRKLAIASALKSPETASSECDFDSPMPVAKKRRPVSNALDSDDDDDDLPPFTVAGKANVQPRGDQRPRDKRCHNKKKHAARQFFDEEAELSSEGAEFVSSDESVEADNEQETSLVGFLNDNTQLSQGLNDSEMHGVYLNSVRSPALGNKYKLVHKRHSMAIFSQIPEQDESYMEDSFCVEEDEEEDEEDSSTEEIEIDHNLLQQDSFVDGRRQYCTRRRLKLRGAEKKQINHVQPAKKKRRIIIQDSSDEESATTSNHQTFKVKSPPPKPNPSAKLLTDNSSVKCKDPLYGKKSLTDLPLRDRCLIKMNVQAALAEKFDFQTEVRPSLNISRPQTPVGNTHSPEKVEDLSVTRGADSSSVNDSSVGKPSSSAVSGAALCILADSQEITSGLEVISCLKATHGVRVEICSLGGCDYIVSNRLAVERKIQTEFSNSANRSKLVERFQHLQSMFDRVCLIVETDRVKPGETSRLFQRTKYYDNTLSALISAGIQILFSSSQEETAGLLNQLASLERRKGTAMTVPTQMTSHKQEMLNFYLSLPNVSYITALNLCQHFSTVRHMANSSVEMISSKGLVSQQKAEEIVRYLHYVCDPDMLQAGDNQKPAL